MARLLLVRHGVTEHNSNQQFAGYTDTELTDEGFRQAEKLSNRLAGENIDAIYSSDLKRAVVTAEAIASRHKAEIIQSPEIREMNYGDAEGMTFSEIHERYPEIAELIIDLDAGLNFPGGESFKEFVKRTCRFLDIVREYEEDQTVLIVAHGGVLRVLVCDLLGIGYDHFRQIRIDNASLSMVDIYPHRVILSLLNDTSHLRDTA